MMRVSKFPRTVIFALLYSLAACAAAAANEPVGLSRSDYAHRNQVKAQEAGTTPTGGTVNFEKLVVKAVYTSLPSDPKVEDLKAEGKKEEGKTDAAQPNDTTSFSRKVKLSIPVPRLFDSSSQELTLIDKTYLDAYSILQESNDCSQFFGGPRVATVVLNSLYPRLKQTVMGDNHVGIRMFGSISFNTDFQTGVSYRLFQQALINLRGPFYQSVNYKSQDFFHNVGRYPANTREARVSMLLHELGHLLLGLDGRWLLPDDGGNRFQIDANTATIMRKCSEQIKALKVSGPQK